MEKIILKILRSILNFILDFQGKNAAKKLKQFKPDDLVENGVKNNSKTLCYQNSTSKTYLSATESLTISAKSTENNQKTDKKIREIVKKNVKTPEKLLEYVEKSGTKVYKIKFANKILKLINEPEGFILPLKGFRALFLNLILEQKFSFFTDEMFVLRDCPVNIYMMSHQFHKWYGFKMRLCGFEKRAVELFREVEAFGTVQNIDKLTYSDIMALKEALRRDIEAIDFVVSLSKENDGAAAAIKNIKDGTGAKV